MFGLYKGIYKPEFSTRSLLFCLLISELIVGNELNYVKVVCLCVRPVFIFKCLCLDHIYIEECKTKHIFLRRGSTFPKHVLFYMWSLKNWNKRVLFNELSCFHCCTSVEKTKLCFYREMQTLRLGCRDSVYLIHADLHVSLSFKHASCEMDVVAATPSADTSSPRLLLLVKMVASGQQG